MARARILISLAYNEAETGHAEDGLHLLSEAGAIASTLADLELRGVVHGQRGAMLVRQGELAAGLVELTTAIELLADLPEPSCRLLLNRGALHLFRADPVAAGVDLRRCAELAAEHGLDVFAAKAKHNLGYLDVLLGDLPTALRRLDESRAALLATSPGYCAVIAVDRARALHDAGLGREADIELADAVGVLAAHKLRRDLAEAQLARAHIALLDGRHADALRCGRAALRQFRALGNDTWAALAELTIVQAGVFGTRPTLRQAETAAKLAGTLRANGLAEDARVAELVAAHGYLARGKAADARAVAAGATALRAGDRIATRLLARLVRAQLADARGRTTELRAGLRDLHRYQSTFGSLDLQTASALHGRKVAALGLAAALADGRPSVVFAWSERARAQASRLPPVTPPEDGQAAAMLSELRSVQIQVRDAQLDGRQVPELHRRRGELERQVRQRSWFASGPAAVGRPAALGRVREALGDGCMVTYLASAGRLHALVTTARRSKLVHLGQLDQLISPLRRVRADLDAVSLSVLPVPVRKVVRQALDSGLARIDAALWRPLAELTGDGPVVIMPTGALATVPWNCLPSLAGRSLSVAPSATWWLAARSRRAGSGVVLAAGPGLAAGLGEVTRISAQWPRAAVLTGADATGRAVLRASAGAHVLHVAAHGSHEPDNPLFSAIHLADGPLYGYDLPPPDAMPAHVVLAACDVGLAVVRPGDEALGMTAAFLHGGAASVVGGVARVSDEAAASTMVAYHGALSTGASPSVALASALAGNDTPVPLVCFGAGW